MSVTILAALISGAALGQQFRVMVLLPASGIVFFVSIVECLAADQWKFLILGLAAVISLQIGYMSSLYIRSFVVRLRMARSAMAATSPAAEQAQLRVVPKTPGRA
jgi:hypothetical protein